MSDGFLFMVFGALILHENMALPCVFRKSMTTRAFEGLNGKLEALLLWLKSNKKVFVGRNRSQKNSQFKHSVTGKKNCGFYIGY